MGAGGLVLVILALVLIFFICRAQGRKKHTRGPLKKRARKQASISTSIDNVDDLLKALERIDDTDYLGLAAQAGQKAKAAIDAGDFDGAWKHYHEQKMYYLGQAKRSEFTPQQTLALEGSVNRSLANILRIEGRHLEALTHFLYYFATTSKRTKTDENQFMAYFNRSKIKAVDFEEVRAFSESLGPVPNFRSIQIACNQWQDKSQRV